MTSVVQCLWDTSSALSSLLLPPGRVSNTSQLKARSPPRCATKGRQEERAFPSFIQFLFQILMDGKTMRICPFLAKSKQPPTAPSSTPGHPRGYTDVAGVEMPKMELEKMTHRGRRGPRKLELSALAGDALRVSATLSLLRGARARPVVGASKWEEKMLGKRTCQVTRRLHNARQHLVGTLRLGFLAA